MVSYFPGSNLRRNLTLSLRPLPPPLYMSTMRRPRRTERTRLPSALYTVNSWPLSLDLNVARMEKSYGNPSKGCSLQSIPFSGEHLTWECSSGWYRYHSLSGQFKGNISLRLALPGLAVAGGGVHGGIGAEPELVQEVHRPGGRGCCCSRGLAPC